HDEQRGNGDFYLAASGDLPLATSGDFLMATDNLELVRDQHRPPRQPYRQGDSDDELRRDHCANPSAHRQLTANL
ncbi:hypothetical protein ACIRRA_16495, partial [Nocardia sp. NPDC101769]|uniref:hypothetical protein n=1 Tax=Nocardia sp. NPDC101769 TaxID=3364333 RepID=UPI00382404CB